LIGEVDLLKDSADLVKWKCQLLAKTILLLKNWKAPLQLITPVSRNALNQSLIDHTESESLVSCTQYAFF